ncbi:MAG: hypothetical protein R3F14_05615 [Polyangiaceae bacterium]
MSATALAALDRLMLSRDLDCLLPADELRGRLERAGWPCSAAVIAAEQEAAGLWHPEGGRFGVHASLQYLSGDIDFPWQRNDFYDYGPAPDPEDSARRLLPVWFLGEPRIWLSGDGGVYLGDHRDFTSYLTRCFDDVVHFWEVLLLLDGFLVAWPRPLVFSSNRPRLEAAALTGVPLASMLGVEAFWPASRGNTRAWTGAGGSVVELDLPGFKRGTDVVCDSLEGIVLAAGGALGSGAGARVTTSEPIPDDLLRELPVPLRERHELCHEYVWGDALIYSEDRYRRRHREMLAGTWPRRSTLG